MTVRAMAVEAAGHMARAAIIAEKWRIDPADGLRHEPLLLQAGYHGMIEKPFIALVAGNAAGRPVAGSGRIAHCPDIVAMAR